MAVYVDGRRVITNAPGAIVRAKTINYTDYKKSAVKTFDSICKSEDLVNCCEDVRIDGYPIATIDSYFPSSSGDEAGIGGGIKSGTVGGKGVFITASSTTFVSSADGQSIVNARVIREGDLVISNAGNCEPAPIEFLNADQVENHFKKKTPPITQLPTEYHRRFLIITGDSKQSYHSSLFINCFSPESKKSYQFLPLTHQQNDSEAVSKRIGLKNLVNKKLAYSLIIYQLSGDYFSVPVFNSNRQTTSEDYKKNPHQQELDQFAVFRLVNSYQLPKDNSAPKKLRNIFCLSNELRARIYDFLIHYQLTQSAALFDDEKPQQIQYPVWSNTADDIPNLKDFIDDWYNLLPASLKLMVDIELNKKMLKSLDDGWLYIFIDGHLWREIEIKAGLLSDVDLKAYAFKESRKARGNGEQTLLLPYKVNGEYQQIEIAYSQQQWSWPRIRYYGGMLDNNLEIRRHPKEPAGQDKSICAKRRAKRFITLKLKSLISDKNNEVLNDNKNCQSFFAYQHYHLVIPNTVRPIENALRDIHQLQLDLMQYVEQMQNPLNSKYFQTALTIYHYFFHPQDGFLVNKKTTNEIKKSHTEKEIAKYSWQATSKLARAAHIKRPQADTDIETAALNLDLDSVKAALKVDKRRRMRDLMRALQSTLLSEMQSKTESKTPYDWHQVLLDWFASDIGSYAEAFALFGTLSSIINFEPSTIDSEFDIEPDHETNLPSKAQKYILTTLEPSHPFYKVLHPTDEALNQAKSKNQPVDRLETFDAQFCDYQWQGQATFNQAIFSYLSSSPIYLVKTVVDAFQSGFKSYATNVAKGLAILKDEKIRAEKFIRFLAKYPIAANHSHIKELKLNNKVPEHGLNMLYQAKEISTAQQKVNKIETKVNIKKGNQKISKQNIYLSTKSKTFKINQIESQAYSNKIDFFGSKDALKKFANTTAQKQSTNNLVHSTTKKYLELHLKQPDKKIIFGEKFPFYIDRFFTSLAFVGALWNVYQKYQELQKDKVEQGTVSLEKSIALASSSLTASYMVEQVMRSFSSQSHVEQWYQQSSKVAKIMRIGFGAGLGFTPLAFIATGASLLDFGLSLKHTLSIIAKDNPGLFYANIASSGIKLATTFSMIGSAAERAFEQKLYQKYQSLMMEAAFEKVTEQELKAKALNSVISEMTGMERILQRFIPFASTSVGIFLIVSGFIIDLLIEAMKESKLTTWARTTPYNLQHQAAKESNSTLMLNFSDVISTPTAKLDKDEQGFYLEILLSLFEVEHHQIKLQASLEKIYYHQWETSLVGHPKLSVIPKPKYQLIDTVYSYQQSIYFDQKFNCKKIKLHFHLPDLASNEHQYRLNAQYQILLEDGHSLPLVKPQAKEPSAGWYQVEPLIISKEKYGS